MCKGSTEYFCKAVDQSLSESLTRQPQPCTIAQLCPSHGQLDLLERCSVGDEDSDHFVVHTAYQKQFGLWFSTSCSPTAKISLLHLQPKSNIIFDEPQKCHTLNAHFSSVAHRANSFRLCCSCVENRPVMASVGSRKRTRNGDVKNSGSLEEDGPTRKKPVSHWR